MANELVDAELPETIPDLMLQYLNELNRKEPKLDDRSVHAAAKKIAWECLRQTFRPSPASVEAILQTLGGNSEAEARLDYMEKKLHLVQCLGTGRDRVKFSLDPLAEYLAGLYILEKNGDSEQRWQEFLGQVDGVTGAPGAINGFLLAVRDCCLAKAREAGISSAAAGRLRSVAEELGRRSGLDAEAAKSEGGRNGSQAQLCNAQFGNCRPGVLRPYGFRTPIVPANEIRSLRKSQGSISFLSGNLSGPIRSRRYRSPENRWWEGDLPPAIVQTPRIRGSRN
jgi:hypothetical protein